jgi:hypothetical protein
MAAGMAAAEGDIRADALNTLQEVVAGMNHDNFIVRQHRRAVEKYSKAGAWTSSTQTLGESLVRRSPRRLTYRPRPYTERVAREVREAASPGGGLKS